MIVVDASVALKWVFEEEWSDEAVALLEGDNVIAPRLMAVEAANALWRRSCTGEITGPEALSFTEVAETLSAATGRRIRYVDETLEEARRSRAHFGAPDWQLEGWITTYTAIARGEHAHVSHDVELLTGRTPISLRELVLH